MILYIVAVKDTAIDAFERPFFVPALGLAIRSFGDEVQSQDSPLHKHPYDFFLFSLGTFDTETGGFSTHQPEQIARGLDYSSLKQD